MKAFLAGIIFLILLGAGAYIGLKYFYKFPADTGSQTFKSAPIVKTGVMQKSNIAQSDFTHVLVASGKSIGVASYSLNLDDYVGKQVEVTGQYSGTTLYADSVKVLQ